MLAEAAEHFDIVIIDAPPTLGLADAPLLAAAAGNVLFVVESGRTRTRAAIEALNRVEAPAPTSSARRWPSRSIRWAAMATSATVTVMATARLDKKRTEILMIPQGADS